jgi:TldD protein
MRAVDAARDAGAQYADAHVTAERIQKIGELFGPEESQTAAFGVRALYRGYWGFAASPSWTLDEAVRLAHEAVAQAKINATGPVRVVDLGTISPINNGMWQSPGGDPFAIPLEERWDFLRSLFGTVRDYVHHAGAAGIYPWVVYSRREKTCATTEGSVWSQTFYFGEISAMIELAAEWQLPYSISRFHRDGQWGWAHFRNWNYSDELPGLIAAAERARHTLPPAVRPVDVGRYDIVMDAATMANLVAKTLVQPTELDRAMGYEANTGGTSYLTHPVDMIGTYRMGSPLVTITANRSQPGAYATVKWDDEGVEPETFTLIQDGVLVDLQTTRESASWLAPYYRKRGLPVRSHGCANTDVALAIPMAHPPNIVLQAQKHALSFEDLVKDTSHGIAIMGGKIAVDQQGKNGTVTGDQGFMREIVNGKLGAILVNGGVLFSTMDLWKNLTALGGESSAENIIAGSTKGEPTQSANYTIRAVPGKFTNQAVFDVLRKA